MFKDGQDQGYLDDKNWWFNPEHPHAFRIAKLDEDYPAEYFALAEPPKENITALVNFVYMFCGSAFRKQIESVIEFGCGGGWTLAAFVESGLNPYAVLGFEGSKYGCDQAKNRLLIPSVYHVDFRKKVEFDHGKYDVAICTEVAEHLEVPFHGILVQSLIHSSDLIWFSSEGPEINNRPHLHHPGEMPMKYWENLFDFFGYGCYMLPDDVYNACAGRGRCIFYNRSLYQI